MAGVISQDATPPVADYVSPEVDLTAPAAVNHPAAESNNGPRGTDGFEYRGICGSGMRGLVPHKNVAGIVDGA
jgi:hypothetical protein